jgi:PadR family transcriptional regulator, regulatory protein AphA
MPASLPASTYAVLGLVDKVPGSSGYDLVTVAGRSFAHFWPISQTLLYRELDRLTDLGWVTPTRVEQFRAPGKWTYQTTPEGQRALADWLSSPIQGGETFRSPVLLKFFFAHRMQPRQVREMLAEYRTRLEGQHAEFQAIADKLADVPTDAAKWGRLTALHGLRTAAVRLQWVDDVQAQLEEDAAE